MNKEIVKVLNSNGIEVQADLINAFKDKNTNNEYVICTLNELDNRGYVKIYAGKLTNQNGVYQIIGITDQSEWQRVKELMKGLAKGE